MELAKKALGLYLASVPTYSVIYGTFATLPILLIWIYVAWVIVLLGAVVTAYLPIVMTGVQRMPGQQGWQFEMAVEILQYLAQERGSPAKGLYASDLARRLRVDWQQIDPVLQALSVLDWVGTVQAPGAAVATEGPEPRYVLLVEPQHTRSRPWSRGCCWRLRRRCSRCGSGPAWPA